MTLGKSKKFLKKLNKRKKEDRFLKKSWYTLVAPSTFSTRLIGKTVAKIAQSKFKPEDSLKGRRVEVNLTDLNPSSPKSEKAKSSSSTDDKVFSFKVPERLDLEAITATECLTMFDGYRMTTHKRKSLAKKHQSMIETFIKLTLSDSTAIRIKAICFTAGNLSYERNKRSSIKVRNVRRIQKMISHVTEQTLGGKDTNKLMDVLASGELEEKMRKAAGSVYGIKDMFVEKVKVISIGETKMKEILGSQHKNIK